MGSIRFSINLDSSTYLRRQVGGFSLGLGIFLLSLIAPAQSHHSKQIDNVDFNRDVRPVLDKCLSCHGHDPKAIQGGLRLDNREGATKLLSDKVRAIVPGHPEASELIVRINETNPALRMPPHSSNRILSSDDKETLKRWIEQGAVYKQHWAFVKPVRSAPPKVHLSAWPANPIDNFVLANLESRNLKPSAQADKSTLLRRVSLDLTGLPPSPNELNSFLADSSPKAYEKVVDRLLKSPRYGERMAMEWLDCSRYADSNGYQNDYERYQYRWRDWVINAFNKNMPYDEFTIEQLAGDLLPKPTTDQIVATGFCRNNRLNTEGGAIPEEYHVEYVIDRVQTVSSVWLGLTTGCARCHDHKYDPISQKEFYSLCSFFNNVPETDIGEERPMNYPPLIKAPYPDQEKDWARLTAQILSLGSQVERKISANQVQAQTWKVASNATVPIGYLVRYKLSEHSTASRNEYPAPTSVGAVKADLGRSTGSIHTNNQSFVNLGSVGNFDWNKPFSYGAWVRHEGGIGSPLAQMDEANGYRGWDLHVIEGKPSVHLIHDWPQNAIKVVAKQAIPKAQWAHIFATYDGSGKAKGIHLYVDGAAVPFDIEVDKLSDTILTSTDTHIGRRSAGAVFNGEIDDPVLYDRELRSIEVKQLANVPATNALLSIPLERRTRDQARAITREWLLTHDEGFRKMDRDLLSAKTQRAKVEAEIPTVMVMKESAKPRDTFVLLRGIYDHHGDKVSAATPAFLPKLPSGIPANRLALAKWIVSPENPLTPRVTVNRMWERLFGNGLVETSEDFGTRSSFPTHPELLDWLATELVAKRWNIKALWKELVMSATYRQSSSVPPKLLALDPANHFLARGPRFRLPAEVIRDQAMAAGGYLTEKIGGPSVRPYQPKGIWDETAGLNGNLRNYKNDIGPNLHRRSLYTIWKRTAPPPDMALFDVPSREICSVRRARTDTPLQALTLLNDITYTEAARGLAQRILKEGGSSAASRITLAFRLLLGREPLPAETNILSAAIKREIARYKMDTKSATALLKSGALPLDSTANPVELAAYTVVASTILNMDEVVTKR